MQNNQLHILSTARLQASIKTIAAGNHIMLDDISFIETKPLHDDLIFLHTDKYGKHSTIIFTSVQAVEALTNAVDHTGTRWKIACTEGATLHIVQNKFPNAYIFAHAPDAKQLAEKIIALNTEKHAVFFCGNRRRDTLPEMLRQNNIEVDEVILYETNLTPVAVDNDYDAVLFFSPSQAESFFSINKVRDETVLFAIGNTTADEIRKFSGNKVIVGDEPSKEGLVKKAVEVLGVNR